MLIEYIVVGRNEIVAPPQTEANVSVSLRPRDKYLEEQAVLAAQGFAYNPAVMTSDTIGIGPNPASQMTDFAVGAIIDVTFSLHTEV